MKTKKTKKSTLESLPKELKDRIVIVGTGTPLSGTINHTNVNSTALFPNSTTALNQEQMFPNPSTSVPIDVSKEDGSKKEIPKDFSFNVHYGASFPKIAKQLKKQGLKFSKKFIKKAELLRVCILAKSEFEFVGRKQTQKDILELNEYVTEHVMKKTFGRNHNFILTSTKLNDKEVK